LSDTLSAVGQGPSRFVGGDVSAGIGGFGGGGAEVDDGAGGGGFSGGYSDTNGGGGAGGSYYAGLSVSGGYTSVWAASITNYVFIGNNAAAGYITIQRL
jgi:hypothetical protein